MKLTVEKLDRCLFSMVGSHDLVSKWWTSPNRAFEMQKPIDVWTESEDGKEKITSYILHMTYDYGGS
jgi:uncharacterized protein (DUF2384 family)